MTALEQFVISIKQAQDKAGAVFEHLENCCDFEHSAIHYGHVGTVNEVSRQLDEIIAFLRIKETRDESTF